MGCCSEVLSTFSSIYTRSPFGKYASGCLKPSRQGYVIVPGANFPRRRPKTSLQFCPQLALILDDSFEDHGQVDVAIYCAAVKVD